MEIAQRYRYSPTEEVLAKIIDAPPWRTARGVGEVKPADESEFAQNTASEQPVGPFYTFDASPLARFYIENPGLILETRETR